MTERNELIAGYIEKLKALVGAETDSDLARLLSIDKRTVSAWRARSSVPQKFLDLLSDTPSAENIASFPSLSPLDHHALLLALFRYSRIVGDVAKSNDYRAIWDEFRSSMGLWALMLRARADLMEALRERADHPATAFALVLHDDTAEPEKTTKRDEETLQKYRSETHPSVSVK